MAQKRRKELLMKQKQQRITMLCIAGGIGAVALSLVFCLLFFDFGPKDVPVSAPQETALPYDVDSPFTVRDLTTSQLSKLRQEGQMRVSDGPRGISVGDPLDKLLSRFPTTLTEKQELTDQTGEQSDEEIILYCAEYFTNQNGVMVALPPRGLLSVDSGSIRVTLLAPTSAYPAGTKDTYRQYEHVYCVFNIGPETMTIQSIQLGLHR